LIAPDYPGFGQSEAPPPSRYRYTFDHIAETMGALLEQLNVDRYVLFMQDYGGPVGMRMALAHPQRVQALIVQNANAYEEGLGPKWAGIARYWADPTAHSEQVDAFMSLEGAKQRHVGNSPHPERHIPGDAMIRPSSYRARWRTHAMFQTPRSIPLMPAISRSTNRRTRSRSLPETSSRAASGRLADRLLARTSARDPSCRSPTRFSGQPARQVPRFPLRRAFIRVGKSTMGEISTAFRDGYRDFPTKIWCWRCFQTFRTRTPGGSP
jgi:pimeloyl-ACP methyl ester carboxylesterase